MCDCAPSFQSVPYKVGMSSDEDFVVSMGSSGEKLQKIFLLANG